MGFKELLENFKRNFCNYQEYESRISELNKQRDDTVQTSEQFSIENKNLYDKLAKLKEERDVYYKKSEEAIEDLNNAELNPVDSYCKRKGYRINNFVYKDKVIIGNAKIPCNLREMITPM